VEEEGCSFAKIPLFMLFGEGYPAPILMLVKKLRLRGDKEGLGRKIRP
jgi:hypothetical protein